MYRSMICVPFMNSKMPAIVGILKFINRTNGKGNYLTYWNFNFYEDLKLHSYSCELSIGKALKPRDTIKTTELNSQSAPENGNKASMTRKCPQSQTTDQPISLRGRHTEHS